MKTPPLSILAKQDESFHNDLKSLPPLETNNYEASLNSLAMDSTPPTFFSHVLYDPIRNNPLDSSMLGVFSQDVNQIHSHEEAHKVIAAPDYSPDLSCIPDHHPLISNDDPYYPHDLLGMPVSDSTYVHPVISSDDPYYPLDGTYAHPLISSDDLYYPLDLLGMPVPDGTYVENGDSIQEVGQSEANIEVPDCDDVKNIISEMQSLTLKDRNPIERWNDEVVCIESGIHGLPLDRHCLENKMTINASNISPYTAKSDEQKASNQIWQSTVIMPFQELTNKQLNPPNLKRKRTGQIDLDASCLTLENKESTDFSQSIPTKKLKIHNSDLTVQGRACNNCKCKKSQCLKLYCGCFTAGVYCTGPCSCQNCLNRPIYEHIVLEARKKIVPKVEDPNKSGCNCNKSSCMKKYCECFKGGVGCSPSCNCRGCENIHGRNDRL